RLVSPVNGTIVSGVFCEAAMPPHYSSLALCRAAAGDSAGRLLDVGSGSGFLGIMLGQGAATVAVDISERCRAFSQINSALNRREIGCLRQSCLELGDLGRFDRVVFNSASDPRYEKPDPPLGDALVFQFIDRSLDALLAPG